MGEAISRALLAKEWGHWELFVNGQVAFSGLTPKVKWEASTPSGFVDTELTQWFGPTADIYEITEGAIERIPARHCVVYRLRVRSDEQDCACGQTPQFDEAGDRIVTLRVLCTAFTPVG